MLACRSSERASSRRRSSGRRGPASAIRLARHSGEEGRGQDETSPASWQIAPAGSSSGCEFSRKRGRRGRRGVGVEGELRPASGRDLLKAGRGNHAQNEPRASIDFFFSAAWPRR